MTVAGVSPAFNTLVDSVISGRCPSESVITRTWTATDGTGNSASCEQVIIVVDTTAPIIMCNTPPTIVPPDAPISFTATATDNCCEDVRVGVTGFDCFKFTRKGKRIDKTESCAVEMDGATTSILDTGGVDDHIVWTILAIDCCENRSEVTCGTVVANPGRER